MKRLFTLFAIALAFVASSCNKFDDSEIWDKLNEHDKRITALEELCKQMNTNIVALQTVVNALQKNDFITNVSPVRKDGEVVGYTITFAHSDTITIYHGTNGKDGANGKDGKDGKDGYTPQIGVMKDTDGIYYWTVDGEWLLDGKGNKVQANGVNGTDGTNGSNGSDGKDGNDGADGKDGITPRLKIENDYWYVSYDNGATWTELGKATGEDGKDGQDGNDGADGSDGADGEDGDSIFKSVTQDDEYVYFNLADGTMITLPKHDKENIQFEDLQVKAICCKNWDTNNDGELSYAEAAAVTDIGDVFSNNKNIIAFTELKHFTGLTELSAKAFSKCINLWKIEIPENVTTFKDGNATSIHSTDIANTSGYYGTFLGSGITNIALPQAFTTIGKSAFYGCKLKRIKINSKLVTIKESAFRQCIHLVDINLPYGLKTIEENAFDNCDKITDITIPKSVTTVGAHAFEGCDLLVHIYCMPSVPPTCDDSSNGPLGSSYVNGKIIYVPTESVSAYKKANGWKNHASLIYGYDFDE